MLDCLTVYLRIKTEEKKLRIMNFLLMGRCGSEIAYCLQIFSKYRKSEFRNYLIFKNAFFHDISCHCVGPYQFTKRKN